MTLKSIKKKNVVIAAVFIAVLLVISGFIVFAEKVLEIGLARGGLAESRIENIDFGTSGTVLTNVHLPRLGITIREIRLYASTSDLRRARLGKAFIKGITWQPPQAAATDEPSSRPHLDGLRPLLAALNTYSTEIEIEDINITPSPDLPTIVGKGVIYDRGDRYQLHFSFATDQAVAETPGALELVATASGEVFKNTGAAKAQIEIQQLDLSVPPALTVKRISGWASFELPEDKTAAALIGAQISAGALRLYDIPLTESNLSVSGDAQSLKAVFSTRLPQKAGAKAGNGIQADIALLNQPDQIQVLTFNVDATLNDLDTLGISGVAGSATGHMQIQAQKKQSAAYGDISAYRDIGGTVDITARDLSLAKAFTKANAKLAGKLAFDANNKKLAFENEVPLAFTAQHDGVTWALSAKRFAVDYTTMQTSYRVQLEQAALTSSYLALEEGQADVTIMAGAAPVATGNISATLSSPHKPAYVVPLKFTAALNSLSSRQHATGIDIAVNGLSGALMVKAQGFHDSAEKKGELRLRLVPIEMQPGVRSLEEFFPVTEQYAKEVTGTLGALAQMEWSKDKNGWLFSQRGRLLLRDMGATYNDFPIVGINTVVTFDSLAPLTFTKQQIAIGAFTAGLPLQNGLITLSLNADNVVTVHDGKMEMAGGNIGVAPFTLDLVKQQADIVLTADNLDLKQIFAIAPLEGLSAEGRMQGRLPIAMREGNMSLVDGALSSLGSGVIRYSPQQLPPFLQDDTNQHIVDLRTALANFNFSSLKMGLRGDLLKEQTITLNIEGKNPDFYGGHPVKLNLNVEGPLQNIVRYAPGNETIPDAIQKQIEQFEDANATIAP